MIFERYEIATSRIREIINEDTVSEPFKSFFCKASEFICKIDDLNSIIKSGEINDFSLDRLKELNKSLFEEIYSENYEESFANPEYAVKTLGEEYGKILCYIYTKNRGMIRNVYMGRLEEVVLQMELFTQIYNYFEDVEQLEYDNVYETVYSYEKDNTEIFTDLMIEDRINPDNKFAVDIVMNSDLNDLRYLYKYGEHVGFNELKMAEFLNSLSQEEIDRLAKVYTEGYRIGFINTGKDISKKGTVDIRYSLGFERIIRSAIFNFKKMGLEPVIYQVGYTTTSPNRQYAYDHRYDDALYLDKAYIKRKLEVSRHAYESRKQLAGKMAGPAVIEIFGETPFEPENKKQAYALSEEQQKLKSEYITEYQTMVQEYIKGDERSFTIIAFPIPEFGDDFEQMFKETVKINTLDSEIYGKVQQNIIDALDQAEYVKVLGKGDNKTNMKVQMHDLKNPLKETNFENCLADVNIPLGEVFTSPKLKGTEGILHVSQVYLNDLKYNDLQITFEDGKIKDYTCKNFDTEEENKKFIKQNVMFNHETLPIGEFAIGTNTTAYMVAKKYHVVYKLPILIVEKMGPHFAVGDTCYSFEEDIKTYNPDGKEIVARENEVSALRKTDIKKAYFGCHTDITMPYDELGEITAVRKDGSEITIIKDGRFVLEGTELLNEPLEEI
ncbi:leucyl aminopeptidase [Eubacterium ventriosum]|uniref:Leucyl aminopeptidase n=1 Tax=Eubacterium ventriosum TaxID=39496 RepID=A0A413RB36_9FIRM|nr:leucyl aminopeptidase [Eubacterium ventriosum]RHA19657.1 leucyl aminopeptidase [Eubacterium ventriosum]RHB17215.1 leucyl aminopeptidase [Eubacterium ventriosum]RHL44722.1 leucyl aminopeptidase [Eubacterium ventriosum]